MSSPSSTDRGGAGERPARRVALLGSTGSIGRQTVEVLAAHPDAFTVVALAAGSNAGLLAEQAGRLRPLAVALGDETALAGLDLPPGHGTGRWSGRPRDARHARRRRPRHRRDGRRRQPPTGPGRPARREGRRDGQQGDARGGRPPRHAARARPRGHGRGDATPAMPTPARSPGSARSTRSTRRSGNASSANRWPLSRA